MEAPLFLPYSRLALFFNWAITWNFCMEYLCMIQLLWYACKSGKNSAVKCFNLVICPKKQVPSPGHIFLDQRTDESKSFWLAGLCVADCDSLIIVRKSYFFAWQCLCNKLSFKWSILVNHTKKQRLIYVSYVCWDHLFKFFSCVSHYWNLCHCVVSGQ